MQLLSEDTQKVEKTTPKKCSEILKFFFSPALPNSPKRRIPFSKCGLKNQYLWKGGAIPPSSDGSDDDHHMKKMSASVPRIQT